MSTRTVGSYRRLTELDYYFNWYSAYDSSHYIHIQFYNYICQHFQLSALIKFNNCRSLFLFFLPLCLFVFFSHTNYFPVRIISTVAAERRLLKELKKQRLKVNKSIRNTIFQLC